MLSTKFCFQPLGYIKKGLEKPNTNNVVVIDRQWTLIKVASVGITIITKMPTYSAAPLITTCPPTTEMSPLPDDLMLHSNFIGS